MPTQLANVRQIKFSQCDWTNFVFGLVGIVLAGLFCAPYVALIINALGISAAQDNVFNTVLAGWIINTGLLCVGVLPLAFLFGVLPAWLVTRGNVKNRALFDTILVMPLAMPAYIAAYAVTNAWQFQVPFMRSMPVAVLLLALATYPYVYVMARSAFRRIPFQTLDAAASLGRTDTQIFFEIALPLARPAIAVGLALSLMEVLTDYGTSAFFSLNTLATGVLFAWTNHVDPTLAARLAFLLLAFAMLFLSIEYWGRRKTQVNLPRGVAYATKLCCVRRSHMVTASIICLIPPFFGLIVPALLLLPDAVKHGEFFESLHYAWNSIALAGCVAFACLAVAVTAQLCVKSKFLRLPLSFGYAMPGVIVALAMLVVFAWVQNVTNILLIGSFVGMVVCLAFRFTPLPLRAIAAAQAQIPKQYNEAAGSLGASRLQIFWQVVRPLLQPAALGASLLVMVDSLKELPATMLLRPFNWDTLAVHANALAMDERLGQAALPALMLVAIALPILACALKHIWAEECNDHEPDFSM